MAKPYSLDLRIRVINKIKEKSLTQLQAAKTFDVGIATIKRWVKINKDSGNLNPKIPTVTRPRKVDYKKAKKLIEKNPDKTLKELGKILGTKDMLYVIKKLGITYKKTLPIRGKAGRFEARISRSSKEYSQKKSNLS